MTPQRIIGEGVGLLSLVAFSIVPALSSAAGYDLTRPEVIGGFAVALALYIRSMLLKRISELEDQLNNTTDELKQVTGELHESHLIIERMTTYFGEMPEQPSRPPRLWLRDQLDPRTGRS